MDITDKMNPIELHGALRTISKDLNREMDEINMKANLNTAPEYNIIMDN